MGMRPGVSIYAEIFPLDEDTNEEYIAKFYDEDSEMLSDSAGFELEHCDIRMIRGDYDSDSYSGTSGTEGHLALYKFVLSDWGDTCTIEEVMQAKSELLEDLVTLNRNFPFARYEIKLGVTYG